METATEWSLRTWRDRLVKGYFENSKQHADWRIYDAMPRWFDQLAKPTKDDVALEIGAGYGEWMIPLARHVQHVSGVDIHPKLLIIAAQKFREHGIENAEMFVGDGKTLPFVDAQFTLVYSISVFQHLPREMVAGYLQETVRVLKPEGRAVHMFRSPRYTHDGSSQPVENIDAGHTGDFSCGWTVEQVRDAVEIVGLSPEVHDLGLHMIMVGRPAT